MPNYARSYYTPDGGMGTDTEAYGAPVHNDGGAMGQLQALMDLERRYRVPAPAPGTVSSQQQIRLPQYAAAPRAESAGASRGVLARPRTPEIDPWARYAAQQQSIAAADAAILGQVEVEAARRGPKKELVSTGYGHMLIEDPSSIPWTMRPQDTRIVNPGGEGRAQAPVGQDLVNFTRDNLAIAQNQDALGKTGALGDNGERADWFGTGTTDVGQQRAVLAERRANPVEVTEDPRYQNRPDLVGVATAGRKKKKPEVKGSAFGRGSLSGSGLGGRAYLN